MPSPSGGGFFFPVPYYFWQKSILYQKNFFLSCTLLFLAKKYFIPKKLCTFAHHMAESKWVVIRTFNRKEMEVSSFLTKNELHHFIPMTYTEKLKKGEDKPRMVLVPVVHNYIFVEKTLSDHDMVEFRLLCDPDYSKTPKEFVDTEDAEALPGKEVMVVHGQFKGIRGKLCKKNQKYWFVKTVGGISVMLRISRWYCKVVK